MARLSCRPRGKASVQNSSRRGSSAPRCATLSSRTELNVTSVSRSTLTHAWCGKSAFLGSSASNLIVFGNAIVRMARMTHWGHKPTNASIRTMCRTKKQYSQELPSGDEQSAAQVTSPAKSGIEGRVSSIRCRSSRPSQRRTSQGRDRCHKRCDCEPFALRLLPVSSEALVGK
jgi:hypothetical protein